MRRAPPVRSFRPRLEALESRDLMSATPGVATQFLVPLANQYATASNAALVRLQTANTALAAIQAGTSNPTLEAASTLHAQAASAYQDVLGERRTLELAILADLHFFAGVVKGTPDEASDLNQFRNTINPTLNIALQKTKDNEKAANGLLIVKTGVDTRPAANGQYVNAIDAADNAITRVVEIVYQPLLPSKNTPATAPVTAPLYNYSTAMFPLEDPSYVAPDSAQDKINLNG